MPVPAHVPRSRRQRGTGPPKPSLQADGEVKSEAGRPPERGGLVHFSPFLASKKRHCSFFEIHPVPNYLGKFRLSHPRLDGQPVFPAVVPALREGEPGFDVEQEFSGLGRDLRGPGDGQRHSGPAAAPRHHPEHQGGKLSAQGETQGGKRGTPGSGSGRETGRIGGLRKTTTKIGRALEKSDRLSHRGGMLSGKRDRFNPENRTNFFPLDTSSRFLHGSVPGQLLFYPGSLPARNGPEPRKGSCSRLLSGKRIHPDPFRIRHFWPTFPPRISYRKSE